MKEIPNQIYTKTYIKFVCGCGEEVDKPLRTGKTETYCCGRQYDIYNSSKGVHIKPVRKFKFPIHIRMG